MPLRQEIQQIIEAGYSPQLTAKKDTGTQCYSSKERNSTSNPKKQETGPVFKLPEKEHRLKILILVQ